jgi:outer membrane protein assembly factor BamB
MIFSVDDDGITARRGEDGLEEWKVPIGEPIAAELTWENGWLIAGTASGSVLAFRARDGELIWRVSLEAPLHAPAALSGERVYLPVADGHVVALRLDNGAPLWKFRLGDAPNEILALAGRLYVGSNDKYFYCLKAETGERYFRWPTGADVVGRPIIIDRRVFFASLDNFVYALDARSGSQQWAAGQPTRPVRGVTQAGDAVLVSGLGNTVLAFRARNGERLPDITLAGPIVAPPAFVADPGLLAPIIVIVSHEIEKGAMVTAYTRSLEVPQVPLAQVQSLISRMLGVTPMKP